jgi:hypothetical protein
MTRLAVRVHALSILLLLQYHKLVACDAIGESGIQLISARSCDCVRQDGVNWETAISTVGQVVVSVARVASSLAAMPVIVSNVR